MAITINWATRVINVPQADLQFVENINFPIYQLDLDAFRLSLKNLEYEAEGMAFLKTHDHNPPVTVGGVTLARVVEIVNGYTVTFENGSYAVNLVGANSNVADVTNLNNVQVRSANSAGLTFSDQINAQSFTDNLVYINTVGAGNAGTQFPRGTPTDPVNNWTDALQIAVNNNLLGFDITGVVTLPVDEMVNNYNFHAHSPIQSYLVFQNNNITACTFDKLGLTGTVIGGRASFKECSLSNFTGFYGLLDNSGYLDNVTLSSIGTENIVFKDCISVVAGNTKPVVDCNGTAAPIHFRDYTGGLEIRNFTNAAGLMSIDCVSGRILIDSTCTAGEIVIGANAIVVDNSGPGCTVIQSAQEIEKVDEIYKLHGLSSDTLTITDTARTVGGITQDITDTGTTTTITRQ